MTRPADTHTTFDRRTRRLIAGATLLIVTIATAVTCLSQTGEMTTRLEMTKIVYRRSGPKITPDSAEAKPITIYRAGDKYCRSEASPDPARKMHMLRITKEPDDWIINLADHTGTHRLDAGPTFNVRLPIFWAPKPPGERDPDELFQDLEYGKEKDFFSRNHATDVGLRKVDGKDAKAFSIKTDTREATLLLDPETEKPLQLEVTKAGKPEITFHYTTYETGLSFDPALFELPEGVKITEAANRRE